LANKTEGQEKRNTVISWAPTACNQSGERRKDICEQDVFTRCTDKKDGLQATPHAEFHSDLSWWHIFLESWNGLSLLRSAGVPTTSAYCIQTDASGAWGCAAYFNGLWFQLQWDSHWKPHYIMVKELLPIVLSGAIWGFYLGRKTVMFQCDNSSVVTSLQKGSSKDPASMHLLRCLWFFTAHNEIDLIWEHIPGSCNTTADYLSRNNLQSFFSTNTEVSLQSTPLPRELLAITAVSGPDWTAPAFQAAFLKLINLK